MIGISTLTQNAAGSIIFKEKADSKFLETSPRISRTGTLDGGAVITHSGFCQGDRTFTIIATMEEANANILKAIYEGQTIIYLACFDGFFLGAIDNFKIDHGELNMSFLVKEKLG